MTDKRLTAVNDIVSTKIISQFTICLLMLNKQNVCGIPWLHEWQKYLQAPERGRYLLPPSPPTIRYPFDSRAQKENALLFFPPLFSSCFFFL